MSTPLGWEDLPRVEGQQCSLGSPLGPVSLSKEMELIQSFRREIQQFLAAKY